MEPPPELFDRVERLLGSRPVDAVFRDAGYSAAGRWTLTLEDSRTVFAKLATTDDIARRLRDEHRNMASVPSELRCGVFAFEDGDRPLLLVEDLSHGHWPPPWRPGDLDRVREAMARLAAVSPAEHLPSAEVIYRSEFSGWRAVSDQPEEFLSLGLVSRAWLDRNIPALVEAERSLVLEGDEVVHWDIRGDNLCLLPDRVVFVDWNFLSRGRAVHENLVFAASQRLEGGVLPEELLPDAAPEAAAVAGFFAQHSGKPPPEGAPTVRHFQLRQLRIALPWACRELGLDPPDIHYAQALCDDVTRRFRDGGISEQQWYEQIEEVLIDAYLAEADPVAQSGKGGGEADWRWGRELALDALAGPGGTVLDVGCANGYLMESFETWRKEQGLEITSYGLEISWRMADLARRERPALADRIFTGNVLTWDPQQRFDLVHAALDYAPPGREADLVRRILDDYLVPGGRLVLRGERARPGIPSPAEALRNLGFEVGGIIERPRGDDVRRTAWVEA